MPEFSKTSQTSRVPPFSPVLISGLVAGRIFPDVTRPIIAKVARRFAAGVWTRHQRNFKRMADYEGARFLIDPVDLPLVFILELAPEGPKISVTDRSGEEETIAATIKGPLNSLLDLAQGKVDGDMLFFNRDLSIEGDTEAVLALRNAIDDAELDLVDEFSKSFGPLAGPAFAVAERSVSLFQRLAQDTKVLQDAVLAPLANKFAGTDKTMSDLEERLGLLERQARKQAAKDKSAAKKQKSEAAHG